MLQSYGLYQPIGPLSYLIMDKDGSMVMGLFDSSTSKELVFLLNCNEKLFVLHIDPEQLMKIMRNQVTIGSMIKNENNPLSITDTLNQTIDLNDDLLRSISNYLDFKIQSPADFIVLPNYYYTYCQHIFDNPTK